MHRLCGLVLASLSLLACDGGSATFDSLAEDMSGVYRVTGFTHNDAACVPGGESVLGNQRFMTIIKVEIFGTKLVSAFGCSTLEECRSTGLDTATPEFVFSANEVGTNDSLVGQGASTGFEEEGVCTDAELTTTTFALGSNGIQIEHAISIAPDHPVDDDGFCTTKATQAAARGVSCSELEVLTAEFVEPL